MGQHEPLTSLALGRSPYDDVVEGEGEADPREPEREYDERGRVINPETKRITSDIIRAHNEVMLVIGVAEPDNTRAAAQAAEAKLQHHKFENATGRHFLHIGRLLVVTTIWGVHGVRQRILVYRETARFPFLDLLHREATTHSPAQLLFAGMPSFFSAWSLQWSSRFLPTMHNSWCLRALIGYIRFHLQIHVAMQRLDLIPGTRWLPGLKFFIPFSSSSPFMAPPPLRALDARTISEWVGQAVMSLLPYAGYYLIGCAWDVVSYIIRRQVYRGLPHPWPRDSLKPLLRSWPPRPPLFSIHPTIEEAEPATYPVAPRETYSEGGIEPLPNATDDGQGTFSNTEGDGDGDADDETGEDLQNGTAGYATDEEDVEEVNPTLISFDVDTSESTEPPTGVWSAELRPSASIDQGLPQPKKAPEYHHNALISLPALLAGDLLTGSLTHTLFIPLDMLAFRGMARAFAFKFNLPLGGMFQATLADGLTTRMMLNLFQAEVLKFCISFHAWGIMTRLARRFRLTDKQWEEYHKEMERQRGEGDQADEPS